MNGETVPPDVLKLDPWWHNLLYNMATDQFVHRAFFCLSRCSFFLHLWPPRHRVASHVLLFAFAAQAALGIRYSRALPLAVAHQSGAVVSPPVERALGGYPGRRSGRSRKSLR